VDGTALVIADALAAAGMELMKGQFRGGAGGRKTIWGVVSGAMLELAA
jgi:hypothetical protein